MTKALPAAPAFLAARFPAARFLPAATALLALCALAPAARAGEPRRFKLDSTEGLELINARAAVETHAGRKALRLLPVAGHETGDDAMLAIVGGTDFHDGTIELELAGARNAVAVPSMRGFIGVGFRVQRSGEPLRFECFYLRTLNGRSDDQLQRNHSAQYVSEPSFGWKRLRTETPGKYEAYVDLEPGAWTRLKIVVSGTTARLFVHGAAQPVLVVTDLKLGDAHGPIALWSHESTDGFFSNLIVR